MSQGDGLRFPVMAVVFHSLAFVFFSYCTWRLYQDLTTWPFESPHDCFLAAVTVFALALAVISLSALVRFTVSGASIPLRARAETHEYLFVLMAVASTFIFALRLASDGRLALAALSLGVGLWLFGLGFGLVPRLSIGSRFFVSSLGKLTAVSRLNWHEVKEVSKEPPRAVFYAGRDEEILIILRCYTKDAERACGVLARAGAGTARHAASSANRSAN